MRKSKTKAVLGYMAICEWLRCVSSCQKSSLRVGRRTFRYFMTIGLWRARKGWYECKRHGCPQPVYVVNADDVGDIIVRIDAAPGAKDK